MPKLFETAIGRRFYEVDVPGIRKALERIAAALEALAAQQAPPPESK